ncbi:MAG: serine hydrolase domain-containing protein [Myxococcota bacterium]
MPAPRTRRIRSLAAIVLLSLACSGESLDVGVPPAAPDAPAAQGLAWWSRAAMDAWFRFEVWRGNRSGFVAAFARDGRPVHATAVGWADIEEQVPMALDTRVRMASMTKAVTAVAALILIDEGRLDLDDPVARWIPAFADVRVAASHDALPDGSFETVPPEPAPTVRHLLMFASGVGPGMRPAGDLTQLWEDRGLYSLESGTLAERVDHLATLPLFEHPGERWRYGWSGDVLARVVEVASGEPFDAFLAQRIFEPLGMTSTAFLPPPDRRAELARVYTQDEDGELVIAPREHRPLDWTPGGSGLVSTVGDYLRFAMMLGNEGSYDGARILSPGTVREMRQAHVPSGVLEAGGPDGSLGIDGLGWGLGVSVVVDSDATPFSDRDGDFWWAGYFGTTFFVSPETGLVGVVLSQNEPGPHSNLPIGVYVAQGLAFAGL